MAHEPLTAARSRRGKKHRRPVFPLMPGAIYTTDQVMRAVGWGRDKIGDLREAGTLTPYPAGKYVYYQGDEIIQAIIAEGNERRKKPKA